MAREPAGDLRLFVAFDLPEAVKRDLAAIQDAWQQAAGGAAGTVKWTAIAGVHLTLKFLGATPPAKVDLIRLSLTTALAGVQPLAVRLAAPGVFPNPQRTRVLWVGMGGEIAALERVQQQVERALAPLGFPADERRFQPHLTLGRVRDEAGPAERRALGEAVAALATRLPARFTLDVVHLMRSELKPTGARYTSIAKVALGQV